MIGGAGLPPRPCVSEHEERGLSDHDEVHLGKSEQHAKCRTTWLRRRKPPTYTKALHIANEETSPSS